MTRYLGQFEATDPSGLRYTLMAWADDAGSVAVQTRDGHPVGRVGKGRYHLVRGHLVVDLTSDDPAAPWGTTEAAGSGVTSPFSASAARS